MSPSPLQILAMQAAIAAAAAQEGVEAGEWSQEEANYYIKQELTELAARKGLTFEDVRAELERIETQQLEEGKDDYEPEEVPTMPERPGE